MHCQKERKKKYIQNYYLVMELDPLPQLTRAIL